MSLNCFVPYEQGENIETTIAALKACPAIQKIFLLSEKQPLAIPNDCQWLQGGSIHQSSTLKTIAKHADSSFVLIYTKTSPLKLSPYALERFIHIGEDTGAGLIYSNYYENKDETITQHPVIDYQKGSLRDDFDFGSLLFFNSDAFCNAAARIREEYTFAGLYDLRLKLSQKYTFSRIPEFLYMEIESDIRKSGEKIFDYVDPKNRQVQIEMEKACTVHLKEINGYLAPQFESLPFNEGNFAVEASVVIPVRNRVKTIEDAVKSVLAQKTKFPFNLLVVDNYSTDGTTGILRNYAQQDKRLIHIIPANKTLGIGGCWDEAVMHPQCGKFVIQLDSDDLYIDENTIQTVVDAFYEQQCGMVVGSYKMVNFKLEEIPPGLIDHKEWTPENGRNNALRINGLGAPRAFYTPLIRKYKIPNVSYGEDYAIGLAISRQYQIGRIYAPLYLCRRWDENSDASLDVVKTNNNNLYKDWIRTVELEARIRQNQTKK